MSASHINNSILEETEFVGEISINGETAPIVFRAWAGSDCRLHLHGDAVQSQTYFLAARSLRAPGKAHEEFTLTGTSADGKAIASEHVFLGGLGHNNERRWIDLRSRACKVTFPLTCRVEKPVLNLWFRSFVSFRNPIIETSLGRLRVWGEAADVRPDDMSGCMTLEAAARDPGDGWRDEADDFLRHMHRGLALAHGGRLQTPRLDFIHDLIAELTFFEGAGFAREFPVQHSVHQGPFITALVQRYERAGPLPDILWTALGWMQTDTTFDETRFQSGMTALEAIIESGFPEGQGTIIPREEFRSLRHKLEKVITCDVTSLTCEMISYTEVLSRTAPISGPVSSLCGN